MATKKYFLPLTTKHTYIKDPKKVLTFQNNENVPTSKVPCVILNDPKCLKPEKPAAVSSIEDEIFKFYEGRMAKQTFNKEKRKPKCKRRGSFESCVLVQRTPSVLKQHAVNREHYLKAQRELHATWHNAKVHLKSGKKLVRLDSPDVGGDTVKPRIVDSVNSLHTYYVPTRKLLDVKKPRSGIYINQPDIKFDTKIPFESYNPRIIQKKIEEKNIVRYDLLPQDADGFYAWTDVTQDQDNLFINTKNPEIKPVRSYECINFEPSFFVIPCDLDRTFRASIIFGEEAVKPVVIIENDFLATTFPNERRKKEIACCYAIYIESFVSNPDSWDGPKLSEIFTMGEEHWDKSNELDYIDHCGDFDVLPEITEKCATVELKIFLKGTLHENPNVLKSIYTFFAKYSAGLFVTRDTYLLIWKRCVDTFFVFDPNGRDSNGRRDHVEGRCALISTRLEEHVVHIILNLGAAEPNDEFVIYEISFRNFGFIPVPIDSIKKVKKKKLYAVVNKFFGLVPATVGIAPPEEADEENSSLMVSFIALLYSQIDPPKYWTISIVDSLIKVGGQRYMQFVRENKLETLDINHLPNILTFGTYRTHLIKHPIVKSGHVSDCKMYRNSLLTNAISSFFSLGFEIGLLQIDNSIMALWKDQLFYYLFDPFRRGKAGQVLDPDDDDFNDGVGCLQIHVNLDSLCRIVNQNANDMKSTGTYFIHGIKIVSVQLLSTHHHLFNRAEFIGLNIRYPFPTKLNKYDVNCEILEEKRQQEILMTEYVPIECLSALSISPCERACSEASFMNLEKVEKNRSRKMDQVKRMYSIESIPEDDRITDFDNNDVVDGVIKDFICDLMTMIKRKTEKRVKTPIEAAKILLKSDRGYLEETLRRLKCGQDFDNICDTFNRNPPCEHITTQEEEIAKLSNFMDMPDGNWAIFGSQDIEVTSEKMSFALLSALAAILVMSKYHIHSWSIEIVDFVEAVALVLETHYDVADRALETIMKKKIPEVQIGKFIFQVVKKKTVDSMAMDLKNVLQDMLVVSKKILLVYNTFSCAITKPGHLFYMYMAFPSDGVGYRISGMGPPVLLRLLDLDAIVQRIEGNRFCLNATQPFIMLALEVRRVSEDPIPIYLARPDSEEEITINTELGTKAKADKRLAVKTKFIGDEILKEKYRVSKFLREKRLRMNKGKAIPFEVLGEEEMEEVEEEEEDFYEPKHKPGRVLSNIDEYDEPSFEKIQPGYRLCEDECMFKIQGSISLEDRATPGSTEIKTCYLASVFAILNAILTPVNKWDGSRIDKVIECAKELNLRVKDRTNMSSRIIKNVRVDDYIFNILVKVMELMNPNPKIDYYIEIVSQSRNFFIIQVTNCCFGIYKDEYFHLFDPYKTLELTEQPDEEEEEYDEAMDYDDSAGRKGKKGRKKNKKSKKSKKSKDSNDANDTKDSKDGKNPKEECLDSVYKIPDKNTASWVLFAEVKDLLSYINKRASDKRWRMQNKILVIDILQFKQASRKERISYHITDDVDCSGQPVKFEDLTCLKVEKVAWLESPTKLVPWSRLNRKDQIQQINSKGLNKDKSYDVEIPSKVFSLWGTIHPLSAVFRASRGKQYLGVNVIACCMASVFKVTEWNSKVIDSIVINGNRYFKDSVESIKRKEHEFCIEDLDLTFRMDHLSFKIHLESVVYGRIYSRRKREFSMSSALGYFFGKYRYGVIQTMGHSIAIGRADKGYFMLDCQSHGLPVFAKDQGAAYVLRTNNVQMLLYCLIMTFSIPYYNIEFVIHKVDISSKKVDLKAEKEEKDKENAEMESAEKEGEAAEEKPAEPE